MDAAEKGYAVDGIDVVWATQAWVLPTALKQSLTSFLTLWKEVYGA